jgi:hypothetical protein
MNDNKIIDSLANTLISQYGDDAETVAMLRAAEHAAQYNEEEWIKWEKVVLMIQSKNQSPKLDG